jgi:hypothetical protein
MNTKRARLTRAIPKCEATTEGMTMTTDEALRNELQTAKLAGISFDELPKERIAELVKAIIVTSKVRNNQGNRSYARHRLQRFLDRQVN